MRKLFYPVLILALLSCTQLASRNPASQEVSNSVKQLVDWETKSNLVSTRSNEIFDFQHYEIPLTLLKSDFSDNLDEQTRKALVFEKDGEQYVRWVINPEDTRWHLDVKEWLISKAVDPTPKTYLKGYLTASRSMIAIDPETQHSFSIKVSTNNTGGRWTDKKQTWKDAKDVRKITDFITDTVKKMKTETLIIQDEPLGLGIEDLDQGLLVRSLNDVPSGKKYYLPGFSALHPETGKKIAALNGSNDPAKFWLEHYVKPTARATAELAAFTSAYFDSPHSQNFMIELNENMKPTGRIVLKDLADTYLIKDFIGNSAAFDILEIWDDSHLLGQRWPNSIGFLHGNRPPRWINYNKYQEYATEYFKIYESKFNELTGVALEALSHGTDMPRSQMYSYYTKRRDTTTEHWQEYIKFAACLNGEKYTAAGVECPEKYLNLHKGAVTENCINNVNTILRAQ